MSQIDQQLSEIRRRHRSAMMKEVQSTELQYYCGKFPNIKITSLINNTDHIVMTYGDFVWRGASTRLELKWDYDQYLNGIFTFQVTIPPVQFIPIFADIIRRYEKIRHHNYFYQYRILQGLYIHVAETYYHNYTANDMLELLRQADNLPVARNDRDQQGFRAWLLTRSYTGVDGGAINCHPLLHWAGRDDFKKLVDK